MIVTRSLTAFALAAACSAGAHAQMYKCVGADGKPSYGDRPCATGARQSDVKSAGAAETAAPTIGFKSSARINYYELTSADYSGLHSELTAKGPGGFHGQAKWKVSYTFRWNPNGDGSCTVAGVVPVLDAEIALPRWTPGRSVSPAQRANWERYAERLKVHEDGHIDRGRQAAGAVAGLSGMRGDCGSIQSTFQQRADEAIMRYSAMDAQYDAATNHGETQGAQLPR